MKVMATGRGITDTKIYDREAVVDRYGIPPELIPDFYGLKGDTSDNIPGVPGIGDKTAAQLLQRVRRPRERAGQHRQDLRRQAQGEPDQPRRGRARLQAAGHRDPRRAGRHRPRRARWRASPTARACARCSASSSCATRCGASRRRSASEDAAAPRDRAVGHDDGPRAARWRRRPGRRSRASTGRAGRRAPASRRRASCPAWATTPAALRRLRRAATRCCMGEAETLAEVLARLGRRGRWSRTTGSRIAAARGALRGAAARARHDGGGLPDRPRPARLPARRAGRGHRARRRGGGRRRRWRSARCSRARWPSASARCSRSSTSSRLLSEVELPLVDVLVEMERAGVKLDVAQVREIATRRRRAGRGARARDLGAGGRGVHDRLAAAARRRSCSRSSACRRSAAARPASPPTPACSRPSATSTRSSPRSRRGAS